MTVADKIFNQALSRVRYFAEQVGVGNAAFGMLLCKSAGLEADATLVDHDTIQSLLAGTTDECDFTNYARKTITSGVVVTVDDTNNRVDLDAPDQTWVSAGGASNNTVAAAILYFDADTSSGTDANLIPVAKYDVTPNITTDGSNLLGQFNTAGFARSSAA